MNVGLHDLEFAHIPTYCGYDSFNELNWVKNSFDEKILVFTERCYGLVDDKRCRGKYKIAMPVEPRAIHSYAYDCLVTMIDKFDAVITFDRELYDFVITKTRTKAFWYSPGGSWIWEKDWKKYDKVKNVSIVASSKMWTDGHRLRHDVISKYENMFDLVCGYGKNPIEPKLEIFKDYRYSVVIENSKVDYYWTDKLIDCFACWTVPIFWGCPSIGHYFNLNGLIQFDNIDDLDVVLKNIGPDDYTNRLMAIEDNFNRAKEWNPVEKNIYNNCLKHIGG